jgi:hypothetical protein
VPSITPAAVASALAAAAAGRRHTLSSSSASPAAATINSLTPAQKQRLEQIRHYQQLIAQLNATMPAAATTAADTSVAALLPFEARAADHTKVESGFNAASLGLNPMSADDPSWIGHGFQAHAAEDFLSSPDWTDPSPALTDSMSFEIDSCGPSPLLPLDSYDDDLGVPGIAGAPLFPPQDGYASSNVSPLELASHDFGVHTAGDFGAPEMSSDFSLFPDAKPIKLPVEMAFSKLGKPAAGSASSTEDPALTLLRALSSAALSSSATTAAASVATSTPSAPALTASPLAFTSMAAPLAPAPAPVSAAPALAPAPAPAAQSGPAPAAPRSESSSPDAMDRRTSTSSNKTEARGTKRRLDTTDLLPLDAPIQKRNYYTVSATSRRDTAEADEFAEEEAAIRREKDPRVAKRLSNTLAARRSRHRKAEELRLLHEKIEALSGEVESWKRRCELAERERDEARGLLA